MVVYPADVAAALVQEARWRREALDRGRARHRRDAAWPARLAEAQATREAQADGSWLPLTTRLLGPGTQPQPVVHRFRTDRCERRGADGQWAPATVDLCATCAARHRERLREERANRLAGWTPIRPGQPLTVQLDYAHGDAYWRCPRCRNLRCALGVAPGQVPAALHCGNCGLDLGGAAG